MVTLLHICMMRGIATKTLKSYWGKFPQAKQSLLSWHEEAANAVWNNADELKSQYKNASIITDKRVVFNINGNAYRLIVDIEYRLKIVFIVWFGTHKMYDKINVGKIGYAEANKK